MVAEDCTMARYSCGPPEPTLTQAGASWTERAVSAPSARFRTPADAVTLSGRDVLASPPSCTLTSTERVGRHGGTITSSRVVSSGDHPASDPGEENHIVGGDRAEVRASECDVVARVHGGGRKRAQDWGKHRPRLEVDRFFGAISNGGQYDVLPQVTAEPNSRAGQPSRVALARLRRELGTHGSCRDLPFDENPVRGKASVLGPYGHGKRVDQKLRGRAELAIPCYDGQSDIRRGGGRRRPAAGRRRKSHENGKSR